MKKFIIAFALCLACFTLAAQQNIYVIDNVTVKNFDGTQLQGKIITNYQISTQGSGKKAVTVHAITTAPTDVTVSVSPIGGPIDSPIIIRRSDAGDVSEVTATENDLSQAKVTIRDYTGASDKAPVLIIDAKRYDDTSKAPVLIIDAKRYDDTSVLKTIDPKQIKSITVLKDEAAIKAFDAPNGVIIVDLKKDSDK